MQTFFGDLPQKCGSKDISMCQCTCFILGASISYLRAARAYELTSAVQKLCTVQLKHSFLATSHSHTSGTCAAWQPMWTCPCLLFTAMSNYYFSPHNLVIDLGHNKISFTMGTNITFYDAQTMELPSIIHLTLVLAHPVFVQPGLHVLRRFLRF